MKMKHLYMQLVHFEINSGLQTGPASIPIVMGPLERAYLQTGESLPPNPQGGLHPAFRHSIEESLDSAMFNAIKLRFVKRLFPKKM